MASASKDAGEQSEEQKVFQFWYYEWLEGERDNTYYKGKLKNLNALAKDRAMLGLHYGLIDFLFLPTIDEEFRDEEIDLSLFDNVEEGKALRPDHFVHISFKTLALIRGMRFLKKDIREDHLLCMEDDGWSVPKLKKTIKAAAEQEQRRNRLRKREENKKRKKREAWVKNFDPKRAAKRQRLNDWARKNEQAGPLYTNY